MENEELVNQKIREAKVITIWGHTLPDGDCYGSQIGLREMLRLNYPEKEVYAIGSGMPVLEERLAKMDVVSDEVIASSLAILVDVSCLRRVEDQRVQKAKDWIKFDHHIFNNGEYFPYPGIVDPERVSAAELIVEWGIRQGYRLNRLAAEAFYLGIATDSGNFMFHGVCSKTFATASKLFEYEVSPYSLLSPILTLSVESIRFRAFLIDKARTVGNVCYVYLSREDYISRDISFAEASSMVNILAAYKSPIYCLFTEDEKGYIRGEIRSEHNYAVQPVAKAFGGGGHLFAAGLTLKVGEGPMVEDVVAALNKIQKL
ncbi:MAG: bifunctional oligoribonuclease/PAP phosphatase NrnA [Bacilli bacterium]|nr:bifunctional oligoribonuclease/PAP phosphatase NrnA [Bacilli bacterium]